MPKTETVEPRGKQFEYLLPDDELREQAKRLVAYLGLRTKIRISSTGSKQAVELPDEIALALAEVARHLALGDAVTVVSTHQELTTSQAAKILGVSRQYLVRLLDEQKLPCTRTGVHRRVRLTDVLAYRTIRDRQRREALAEMTRLAQEMGGYDLPE